MKTLKLGIFLAILFLIGTEIAGAKTLFGAGEFYLHNGMRVIVVPNHRVPIIKHMLWYKAGAADEIIGKGGTAHLLEHMMFRGTNKIKGQNFNRLMEEMGAESNAFTGQDMTVYHQLLDKTRLEAVMYLEADRMQNLQMNNQDVATERDIVFEERKQRIDNNPLAKFGEILRRILWQNHAYGRPVTGTDEEIKSLSKDDLLNFYRNYYAPNNAVLVLAGDINLKEAKFFAEKYYGDISESEIIEANSKELVNGFKAKIEVEDKDIQGVRIIKMMASPSFGKDNDDIYELQLLAAYMGDGESSKLYKKLVIEDKKALNITVDYNPLSRSYGTFSISMLPVAEITVTEAIKFLTDAWNDALDELNEKEIAKVKEKISAGLVYLRDNPEDAAYIVGSMAVSGMSLSEIEAQEQRLRAVNYDKVKKAAERLMNNAPQVLGILKPKGYKNG